MIALTFALLCSAAAVDDAAHIDTLVVCPRAYVESLRPWWTHRMGQGRRVAISTDTRSPQHIRGVIRRTARGGKLTHILLVGDDHPDRRLDERLQRTTLPAQRIKATVNVQFGSEAHIGTDNWYADLDDDQVPDVAIGRLTADSPEELAVMVKKILDYQTCRDQGTWRRQINFVAGVGGFGVVADSVIDMATKKLITAGIPAAYNTSMTYATLNSPYCPDPRRLPETLLDRHNEGCLFWVYIGHGQRRWLDYMRIGDEQFRIFDVRDVPKMNSRTGSPIAVMLACYAGAFDEKDDCLAEEMLRTPGAPVAVICGSRVTMPYANAVLGYTLLEECFQCQHETVGEVLLHAKRKSVATEKLSASRRLLDTVARTLSPTAELLADERTEHLHLYNLLGDPLLQLPRPVALRVEAPKVAEATGKIEITGHSDVAGKCVVELVCRRDRLTFRPPARAKSGDEAFARLDDIYQRANNQRWTTQSLDIAAGEFGTTIHIPGECHGPCHVRVFVEGEESFALGAADVYVRRVEEGE